MTDFIDKLKESLKGIHPFYVVGFLAFVVYLLERHIWLAGFVIFGSFIAFSFKKYGVIVISIIADIADYIGASVPILGDFLDIFVVIIQTIKYGKQGLVGLFELIPLVDLLPILSINAGIAQYRKKHSE